MSYEDGMKFRTAAIGGFNKGDVNAYIAKYNETKTSEINSLKEEITSLRSRNDELEDELSKSRSTLHSLLTSENDNKSKISLLEKQLAEKDTDLKGLKNEVNELSKNLLYVNEENKELVKREADSLAKLTELEIQKSAIVDLQIQAKLKAESYASTAKSKVDEVCGAYKERFDELGEVYGSFKSDAELKIADFQAQLKSLSSLFDKLSEGLDIFTASFEALAKTTGDPLVDWINVDEKQE